MPIGASDMLCEECGKPLVAMDTKRRGGFPAIAAAAIILVALAGAFGFSRMFGGNAKATATRAGAVASNAARETPAAAAFAVCGSNAAGSRLESDLVLAFLKSQGARDVVATVTGPNEQTVSASVNGARIDVRVSLPGSAIAFAGLSSGKCQIGMPSRRMEPVDAAHWQPTGNIASSGSEHVIGLDGIAVIVNAANPLTALTIGQLKEIFTGHIASWDAVGGKPGRIRVFVRDANSRTFEGFAALVLDGAPLLISARSFADSTQLSAAVAAEPDAIGFVGLPDVARTKALRIASGGSAIAPSALSVGRESYPLTRRVYLYTTAKPSPLVAKFVAYVQSDAGQSLVNEDGFVGTVSSRASSRSSSRMLPAGAPQRYRAIVDSLDQASFDFYFNTASDVLDNKALVDIGRLVNIMSAPADRSKKVVLVGYADSTGNPQANQRLSESRATAAAKELEAQGISVQDTLGFGQQLPIRNNDTEAGREKNRRVEIFLTR